MPRGVVRRTTFLALLAGALVPGTASAARCDVIQLETLTVRFAGPPPSLRSGRPVTLVVDVVRGARTPAALAASDVEVFVGLTGDGWGAYDRRVTDAAGRVTASLAVPKGVRGPTELDVEGVRVVVDAPCAAVEEHGQVVTPWARVR